MSGRESFEDIDDSDDMIKDDILDADSISDTNIKVTPSFYIHNALLLSQKSLMFSGVKGNLKDGIVIYRIFIEQIEVLCKAASILTEDYAEQIKEFMSSADYTGAEDDITRAARLTNKKLELLMTRVFKSSGLKDKLEI